MVRVNLPVLVRSKASSRLSCFENIIKLLKASPSKPPKPQAQEAPRSEHYVSRSAPVTKNAIVIHIVEDTLNTDLLKEWLKQGHSINSKISALDETFLHQAARSNSVKSAIILIAAGANINAQDLWDDTPLHEAASNGRERMVKFLLDAGADTTLKNRSDQIPFDMARTDTIKNLFRDAATKRAGAKAPKVSKSDIILAVENDKLTSGLLDAWLKQGHDINEIIDSETLLHKAASYNSFKSAPILIAARSNLNAKSSAGDTPLHVAVGSEAEKIVKFLIDAGADITIRSTYSGSTPLMFARRKSNKKIIALLEEAEAEKFGAKVPKISESAIILAVESDKLTSGMLDAWLKQGHDINKKIDVRGETLLHKAAWGNSFKSAPILIAAASNLNAKSLSGDTPLHIAVAQKQAKVVKVLIDAGADITLGNSHSGTTPLDIARAAKNKEIIELLEKAQARAANVAQEKLLSSITNGTLNQEELKKLIDLGADINIDQYDDLPLIIAARNNKPEMLRLLLKFDANINAKNAFGNTVLHVAVFHRGEDSVKILLGAGADITMVNKNGQTPLSMARAISNNQSVIQLLEAAEAKRAAPKKEVPVPAPEITEKNIIKAVESDKLTSGMLDAWLKQRHDIDEQIGLLSYKATLLYRAAGMVPSLKAAQLLIARGSDVNKKNSSGSTPLHNAVFYEHEEMVKMLLNAGADVTIQHTEDKKTPLDVARYRNNQPIIQLLEEAAAAKRAGTKKEVPVSRPAQKPAETKEEPSIPQVPKAEEIKQPRRVPPVFVPTQASPGSAAGTKPVTTPPSVPKPTVPTPVKPAPSSQPGVAPKATVPPVAPVVAGGAPIVFNKKKILAGITAGTLAVAYAWYRYFRPQIPTDLNKEDLYSQLVVALTNKNYEYAYKLAETNPKAVRALRADESAKRELKQLISQAEHDILSETATELPLFKRLMNPSTIPQLHYLAQLSRLLE